MQSRGSIYRPRRGRVVAIPLVACRHATRIDHVVLVLQDPADAKRHSSFFDVTRRAPAAGSNPVVRRAEKAFRGAEVRGHVAVLPGA